MPGHIPAPENRIKLKIPNLVFGILLMVLGLFISFFDFWIALGAPVFLFGVTTVGIAKRSLLARVIVIGATFIIWAPIAYYIFTRVSGPKTRIVLIPADHATGHFRIIYADKCSPEEVIENDTVVILIPENGIFFLKEEYKKEYQIADFFLLDKNGKRTRIPAHETWRPEDVPPHRPSVFTIGTAGNTGNHWTAMESGSQTGLTYQLFLFYNNDNIVPDDVFHAPHWQDSLADQIEQDWWRTRSSVR